MEKRNKLSDVTILDMIYLIRGKKVMMDRDLATLYGVETRTLNQAVKRNLTRFPADFMFRLTQREFRQWKLRHADPQKDKMGLRKTPLVFTEQGVAMLSSVLNSDTAIKVNIRIIRIFTRFRELLIAQKDILLVLEKLELKMLKQQGRLKKHEDEIQKIFEALKELLHPPVQARPRIGFRQNQD